MIQYARNRPSFDATSPHLYRPRATSVPYPRQSSPATWLTHALSRLPPRLRRLPKLRRRRSYRALTTLLLPLWALLLLYGERRAYTTALSACAWDTWEAWPAGASPHRIALIADPQLVDPHTYPRRGPALWATMFYTDAYQRRSFQTLHAQLAPSDVVFLGDLFDGGREWAVAAHRATAADAAFAPDPRAHGDWHRYTNDYWLREFARFERIYRTPAGTRAWKSLPGNHDLGFGAGVKLSVRARFEAYFGDANRVMDIGNHTFVAVDTVSLSNEGDAAVHGPANAFLDSLPLPLPQPHPGHRFHHAAVSLPPPAPSTPANQRLSNTQPTVLLTHVPLYRDRGTPCGPDRERGSAIPIWQGYQYQNVLQPHLSQRLLEKTKARYVFSGDDHDACDLVHHWAPERTVREVTVKSASWAMGVRRPAVYLVSMWNPRGDEGEAGTAEGAGSTQIPQTALPPQTGSPVDESTTQPATPSTQPAAPSKPSTPSTPLNPRGLDADTPTLQGHLCYLPNQLSIFILYTYAGLLTLLTSIIEVIRTRGARRAADAVARIPVLPLTRHDGRGGVGGGYGGGGGDAGDDSSNKYWKPAAPRGAGVVGGIGGTVAWWAGEVAVEFVGTAVWIGVFYGGLIWMW
ncbi:Metallo-dependent phosphatase-like protein [Geopyxis carbonaria]|nr:Metallo-dependent phosphatase-like protein [Geopyxis carbonaria]